MEVSKEKGAVCDRVKGALIGLLVGDQNGGPIRMALRLAESLVDKGTYNREDVIQRYLNWYLGPPHDKEQAFDTGQTFRSVFRAHHQGQPIDEAAQLMKESAGINAAHRSAPLAMCKGISDEELMDRAQSESRITHVHQLAVECCMATNYLIRQLIIGVEWEQAKKNLKESNILQSKENQQALEKLHPHDKGGFGPHVFQMAIHFLDEYDTFDHALNASIQFAGNANFCPVLVGSIAGARFGASTIHRSITNVVNRPILERVDAAADALAAKWAS